MARFLQASANPCNEADSTDTFRWWSTSGICLRGVALFALAVLLFHPLSAQITITAADVGAQLVTGRVLTSKSDTSTKSANIGTPGATSWDFSALHAGITSSSRIARPDTTPFRSFFPNSTQAEVVGGGALTVYEYLKLGTSLSNEGTGMTGYIESRSMIIPEEVILQLPMTMGTTWTSNFVDSTYVTLPSPLPPQITVTSETVSNVVDAYGSLSMPGGAVYQALRLRTDRRLTTARSSTRSISYSILAANGASVTVSVADTLQSNSGVITVAGVSWSNPVASSVQFSDALPLGFTLMQNYPNPFNPSTTIEYNLSSSGSTSLTITDILGREVATLVNGIVPAGRHTVTWNAEGFPSGVYICRLNAGGNLESRKLMLMK